jgi:predicted nucleic acid-binding protein
VHIELNENTEQILPTQASAHGSSLLEFAAEVLSRYAEAFRCPSFIDLALRTGLPLATFDKAMLESARQHGVPTI